MNMSANFCHVIIRFQEFIHHTQVDVEEKEMSPIDFGVKHTQVKVIEAQLPAGLS